MATVYLAEDLKHDRKVAVKVLRPELAAVLGAERFVQEIKTTANLQHPHILPLFDSGEADSFLYYVMPYIDGETLRDKLDRETQLGVDEAVRITTEIADALDYAHRNNVIHRDIKPENILLHDGRPVVADFGIALAVSAAAGGRMTETGLSLGTPHYMSPEQATADRDLTNRSDIYSLGSVLYEMLTGDPPHTGASAQAIIMKIVTEPADAVTNIRKSVPPHVAGAIAKSLEKLAADRFESAAKFAEALNNPLFTSPTQLTSTARTSPTGSWNRVSVGAIALAALFALGTLWGWLRPVSNFVSRYSIVLAGADRLAPALGPRIALSPDGSRLVYVGFGDGGTQLLTRPRDQLRAGPLSGTDGASQPFFSPTGDAVGFFVRAGSVELRTIPLQGGDPITVASRVPNVGATWGPDGFIYLGNTGPLLRVAANGGTPQAASTLDTARGETMHSWPHALPNGKGILFTAWRGNSSWGTADIAVLDVATGTHTVLLRGLRAWFAESGHLVYQACCVAGELAAAPFDDNALMMTGETVVMSEVVAPATFFGTVDVTLSRNGTLMYVTPTGPGKEQVVWVSRDGTATAVDSTWWGEFSSVKLSPDGRRLAVTYFESFSGRRIGIKHLDSGALVRLTVPSSDSLSGMPAAHFAWLPSGEELMFDVPGRRNGRDLVAKRADDSNAARLILDLPEPIIEGTWSPDGDWLVFTLARGPTGLDIFGIRPGVDEEPISLVASPNDESAPALSPDGRWLAHDYLASGRSEVLVRPFPNTGDGATQVSVNGGAGPVWARSGTELFFQDGNGDMVTATVIPGTPFAAEPPRALFSSLRYEMAYSARAIDITEDGSRFVMIRRADVGEGAEFIVVENWFEELKAKVGN